MDHHPDAAVLTAVRSDGAKVEVRGQLDECPDDPLQRVVDNLPGNLVGGELMAGNTAHVGDRSYEPALKCIERLFVEED